MYEEIFADFSAANKLIERDPIVLGERLAITTCSRILPPDLPAALLQTLRQRLSALSGRMADAVSRGKAYLIFESVLSEFGNELREWMHFERTNGALRQMTVADEVTRCARAGLFEKYLWNGFHVRTLMECLTPEDLPIKNVNYDEIMVSSKTISRESEFWDLLRPSGTSKEFWARRGVQASVIEEAKDRARHVEEERSRSGWNDSPSSSAGPNVAPR
jgi:hypothetical protein